MRLKYQQRLEVTERQYFLFHVPVNNLVRFLQLNKWIRSSTYVLLEDMHGQHLYSLQE